MRALLIALLLCSSLVNAEPRAFVENEGVRVTLYDEPCAVVAVANLPHRATWSEKGATLEGCFTAERGMAIFYFDDRTVIVIPANQFRPIVRL